MTGTKRHGVLDGHRDERWWKGELDHFKTK